MSIHPRQSFMLKGLLPALAAIAFAVSSPPLVANQFARNHGGFGEPIVVAQQGGISMGEAIERVRQTTGARVLDAQDAGNHYRIKVLTRDGVVRVIRVDARNGDMR